VRPGLWDNRAGLRPIYWEHRPEAELTIFRLQGVYNPSLPDYAAAVGDFQRRFCYGLRIMDELLTNRYQLLFQGYGLGDSGGVQAFEMRIVEWNAGNRSRLRPDAALFLLVNADYMISQPYFGVLFSNAGKPLPLPGDLPFDEWFERARRAFELILRHLETGEGEISAHDVMQAIDIHWQELGTMLWWW
jgi:hypothetical protein